MTTFKNEMIIGYVFLFGGHMKEPMTMSFLNGYQLCVLTSGSLIIDTFSDNLLIFSHIQYVFLCIFFTDFSFFLRIHFPKLTYGEYRAIAHHEKWFPVIFLPVESLISRIVL